MDDAASAGTHYKQLSPLKNGTSTIRGDEKKKIIWSDLLEDGPGADLKKSSQVGFITLGRDNQQNPVRILFPNDYILNRSLVALCLCCLMS